MASPKLALDDLGCLVFIGGFFSWLMIRATGHPTAWAVAFSVAGVLGLLWYFQRGLRNSLATRRTGNVFVDLRHVARPGQDLELDVICAGPEARRQVERVAAHLLRGSDRLASLDLERGAEGQRATRWAGDLPIPAGLTPGRYTVQVEVEIPNWPDWVRADGPGAQGAQPPGAAGHGPGSGDRLPLLQGPPRRAPPREPAPVRRLRHGLPRRVRLRARPLHDPGLLAQPIATAGPGLS